MHEHNATFRLLPVASFLQIRERLGKPEMERYTDLEKEDSLYQEQLKDYELHLLRKHFIEFMQEKRQVWAKEYQAATVRAEFESGVSRCDGPFTMGNVEDWLDGAEGRQINKDGVNSNVDASDTQEGDQTMEK